ncbi:hypothetical protein [Pseudomonas auratipiscis]|uniref:Uncharacterized protein n=1 Tax=Pseudomonas auratipiscis TaxID=3115853 RepID=A0AB35WXU7_9PSED|nr:MULTISPECIES: hypothetical protein [unclassified Pseudomonas]MEE1869085.1 hypothetical protein [Pseudomonas sp. 120P]MEE1959732.1 hypothetical protein [Pseudomonas sp. 119P]
MQQNYVLTIRDLLTVKGGDVCGGEAEIAIMDGDQEVDRLIVSGKCREPSVYSRSYSGKPGLTARLVSGVGSITFESHDQDATLASVGLALGEGWGNEKPA